MLLLMMKTPLDKAGNTRFHYQLHMSQESSLCKTVRPYLNMSPGYTRCMASSNLVLNIDQLRKVCILSGPLICNNLEDN